MPPFITFGQKVLDHLHTVVSGGWGWGSRIWECRQYERQISYLSINSWHRCRKKPIYCSNIPKDLEMTPPMWKVTLNICLCWAQMAVGTGLQGTWAVWSWVYMPPLCRSGQHGWDHLLGGPRQHNMCSEPSKQLQRTHTLSRVSCWCVNTQICIWKFT